MEPPDVTLEELVEHDCDPETDEDEFNHRYDEQPNVEPEGSG